MRTTRELREQILAGIYDGAFSLLYPQSAPDGCRARYIKAIESFESLYGERDAVLVSAPGRTEVGGNHTDHQRGNVLAAAVDLDILCVASPNMDGVIRIQSEGFPRDEVDLADLSVRGDEREKAASLIRGIAAWYNENGYDVPGFDAYTTSNVLKGSGLSSSAAFEVAVGNLIKALCGAADVSPVRIAMVGQYAEQIYFGKPSGLMDQMASSVGGFVQIDFENKDDPKIVPVQFDLAASGYHLCIVDTKGSHADLTADYASIPEEMGRVARQFGKEVLREVDEDRFFAEIANVREKTGDRAVLRAMHFFADNRLAPQMAAALSDGDLDRFLEMSIRSGRSSLQCLQNVFSTNSPHEQGLTLALALSEQILAGNGAWRVHGGGFAGTIQAFVPDGLLVEYRTVLDGVFGPGSCHVLAVRPLGGVEVVPELGA